MGVQYVEKGKPEKTCAECKHYLDEGPGVAKCLGHKVSAEGSCNFFEPK